MKLGISEILDRVQKARGKAKKIEELHKWAQPALFDIFRLCYDKIEWELPAGTCPYKSSPYLDQQGNLLMNMKLIARHFLKGSNPELHQIKREQMYIQFLENLDKDDAVLIESVRNGLMPYSTITKELIEEAFPGLLKEDVKE